MSYRLIQVSDLHAGPPYNPAVADALARQATALRPDLFVVSGDFVQRADFPDQWRTIRALVDRLPQPRLVVPGNHDVPMFNVLARMLLPYATYRKQISPDLNPVFALPGLVVVGACTAHGLTIDGGKLSRAQANILRQKLANYGPDVRKVVVWHHPVVDPPQSSRVRRMSAADDAIRLLDELGVDLLLTGHLHYFHATESQQHVAGLKRGTILCQCGTTTSRRGHYAEKGRNSFNVIDLDAAGIAITPHLYEPSADSFVAQQPQHFARALGVAVGSAV